MKTSDIDVKILTSLGGDWIWHGAAVVAWSLILLNRSSLDLFNVFLEYRFLESAVRLSSSFTNFR